jgi:muramoyltetrapeptide carboxypeptidase
MNIDRRRFCTISGTFAASMITASRYAQANVAALPPVAAPVTRVSGSMPNRATRPLIKPKMLRQGDLVGLIAPSGVMDDALLQRSVKNLEALGLKVKPGKNIRATNGKYAGTIAERLDDFHSMFRDRDVKAVWAATGGSGGNLLLPHINYGLLRANPKIFVGYSDITAFHLALNRIAGLVTFHGPVAASTLTDYNVSQLMAVLMSPRRQTEINMSIVNAKMSTDDPEYALRTIKPGIAEGRLIGGNLSLINALIGTPYAAEIRNSLLFLEDINEAPYRMDRMLTQLQQSVGGLGRHDGLRQAAGVIVGVCRKIKQADGDSSPTQSLAEFLDHQLGSLPIPSVYGYSFGHIANQFTLPIGVHARLDTGQQTLTLLEPAVTG